MCILTYLHIAEKLSDVRMNGYRSNSNDKDISGIICYFY